MEKKVAKKDAQKKKVVKINEKKENVDVDAEIINN